MAKEIDKIVSIQKANDSWKIFSNNYGEPDVKAKIHYVIFYQKGNYLYPEFITWDAIDYGLAATHDGLRESAPFEDDASGDVIGEAKVDAYWLSEIILDGVSYKKDTELRAVHAIICRDVWKDKDTASMTTEQHHQTADECYRRCAIYDGANPAL